MKHLAPVLLTASLTVASAGCGADSTPAQRRPNLLLVTLDTVRADRLGAYGYEAADTRVLDALAERGVVFGEATRPRR